MKIRKSHNKEKELLNVKIEQKDEKEKIKAFKKLQELL
jgi:hypothetical protein